MEERVNLIEQLQATPKWEKFEEWYKIQPEFIAPYFIGEIELDCGNLHAFKNFPFMLQKGVFEKFIESEGSDIVHIYPENWWGTWIEEYGYSEINEIDSFEEMLIWYFNN